MDSVGKMQRFLVSERMVHLTYHRAVRRARNLLDHACSDTAHITQYVDKCWRGGNGLHITELHTICWWVDRFQTVTVLPLVKELPVYGRYDTRTSELVLMWCLTGNRTPVINFGAVSLLVNRFTGPSSKKIDCVSFPLWRYMLLHESLTWRMYPRA